MSDQLDQLDQLEQLASEAAAANHARMVETRRAFHSIAEPGFCEYQTAAKIVERLGPLGYDVITGRDAMDLDAAHSISPEETEEWFEHARTRVGEPELIAPMRGGATAVVATRRFGPGPTVAFRFDIDALPIVESEDEQHRPTRERFRSTHEGWMHACGHDGHITLGLGVAEALADLSEHAHGTVKLIYQPAEEGTRGGAAAIAAKGHLDDVDLLIATHLGLSEDRTGSVACAATFMGTFKYRVRFVGQSAHVVLAPHTGRNALLAAASATLNLHSLAPHPDSWFSINVGRLMAGTEQGVTPATAEFDFGVWYQWSAAEGYLRRRCEEVVRGAAAMHGVDVTLQLTGEAPFVDADPVLAEWLDDVAKRIAHVDSTQLMTVCKAGEDATVMIDRVRSRGGEASYVLVGSALASGHHTPTFDFDEASLEIGVAFLTASALRRMGEARVRR
jgi:aminobenzoyl-glutamate utilization protein A